MKKVYLFDWGDTIMKNFPDRKGSMFTWDQVEIMPNADKMLQRLTQKNDCYIATNAKDSIKEDIMKALQRVNLDKYFKDIFCYKELGVAKPSKEYFELIVLKLGLEKGDITMVGDNLETDIYGVQKHGIDTILYDRKDRHKEYKGKKVSDLMMILDIA